MAVQRCKNVLKGWIYIVLVSSISLDVSASELFCQMELDGSGYKLASKFSTRIPASRENFLLEKWQFSTRTLQLAVPKERFECVIDNEAKIDGCAEWRNKEDRFVYVNAFTSSYGDTPAERRAKEGDKITVGMVAGGALVGVVYGPMLVVMSPFLLLGKAVEKQTKKWVEFNHDEFAKALDSALAKAGFLSRQQFIDRQNQVVQMLEPLDERNRRAFESFNGRIETERRSIERYVKAGFHSDAYAFKLEKITLPDVPIDKASDTTFDRESIAASIEPTYAKAYAQFSAVLAKESIALKAQYELAEAERQKQANLARDERIRQEKLAVDELHMRQQMEADRLSKFRKNLKLGDDTFCGPVIDMRGPMVKVAVNAPLQGYASEIWLKSSEIYSPEYGCSNRNGRISPASKPY